MTKLDKAHLDLARYAAAAGRSYSGAMRQIVRRLRELDTPEADIQAATGLNADQLDVLSATPPGAWDARGR